MDGDFYQRKMCSYGDSWAGLSWASQSRTARLRPLEQKYSEVRAVSKLSTEHPSESSESEAGRTTSPTAHHFESGTADGSDVALPRSEAIRQTHQRQVFSTSFVEELRVRQNAGITSHISSARHRTRVIPALLTSPFAPWS